MALYQDTDKDALLNDFKREGVIQCALRGLRTPPAESLIDPTVEPIQSEAAIDQMREQQRHIRDLLTEREAFAHGERLFQLLTQKANLSLHVDDESGLLTLMPIVDLQPGDELLLHYGREWWTHRLLSTLFLAAKDREMRGIRWIELLCRSEDETDVFEPFPRLLPVRKRSKKGVKDHSHGQTMTTDSSGKMSEEGISSSSTETLQNKKVRNSSSERGTYILYNEGTKKEATDATVLIFAIRLSCQDPDFLRLLLEGDGEDGNKFSSFPPVFCQESCDVEVPIAEIRRALLRMLRRSSHDMKHGEDAIPGVLKSAAEEEEGERFHV
ncbi:unnamed protein product [Phytomonas sp. Hart1]|nr:unnamed protein product [Phytomonas sp. Hart1]|eukprot:CCW70317.1 unnamed protein product [Phytomonas sp. isolate Hart1]